MFAKKDKNKKKASKAKPSSKNIGHRIWALFSNKSADMETLFEELEDLLVESDFGASSALALVDELRKKKTSSIKHWDKEELLDELKKILKPALRVAHLEPSSSSFTFYLVLGVNGVGKTTVIAKMAHRFIKKNHGTVTLAAGDTFRAAAIEQLSIHAENVGARIVKQHHGADPAAVMYDAITSSKSRGDQIVLADTAGRMHNKVNLVKELEKIDRIVRDKVGDDSVYKKILVIDATTGQNGMRQAETFHEAIGIDALILSKYDSSAKGGLLASIGRKLNLPFAYLGVGEGMDDLEIFEPDKYLNELLGIDS